MSNLPKHTYGVITTFIAAEDAIREFTGYTFPNRHLLLAAFYGNSNPAHPRQRLALLGDGLVKHNACADWNLRVDARSARAHDFVNWSISNHHLAVAAMKHGLDKHLAPSDVYLSEKLLGTIMEALLGAIYEDCGRDSRVVRSAMTRMGLRVSPDEWKSRRDSGRNSWLDYKEKTPKRRDEEFREETQGETQDENWEATQKETWGKAWKEIQKQTWKKTLGQSRRALRRFQRRLQRRLQRTTSLEKREPLVASGFGSEDREEQAAAGENFEDIVNSYYSLEDASSMASDGSPMESELPEYPTQDPVWRQHGWVSQHCQITLEVAQSKRVIRRRE